MGCFNSVIGVAILARCDGGHDLPSCSTVTRKLIGDHPPRRLSWMFQCLTEETFGSSFVFSHLNHNVDDIVVVIDCAPAIPPFMWDGDDHDFIEKRGIIHATLACAQFAGVVRPEFLAPQSNRFATDCDASLCEQVFDVSKTESDSVIDPHCMTYDRRREAVTTGF